MGLQGEIKMKEGRIILVLVALAIISWAAWVNVLSPITAAMGYYNTRYDARDVYDAMAEVERVDVKVFMIMEEKTPSGAHKINLIAWRLRDSRLYPGKCIYQLIKVVEELTGKPWGGYTPLYP